MSVRSLGYDNDELDEIIIYFLPIIYGEIRHWNMHR